MAREYCVVLGDVIASRTIEDREAFHETLHDTLGQINAQYETAITAPFATLKGIDELAGVLTAVSPVADIQRQITRALHPTQIRLVAVVGDVDVNVDSRDVSQMDGPAFSRADRTLSEIEEEGDTFRLKGKDRVVDTLISDQINLLDIVRRRWTERQMQIIRKSEEFGTQSQVAETLGISKQAVSKHLQAANHEQIRRIEDRLTDCLASYPELEKQPR